MKTSNKLLQTNPCCHGNQLIVSEDKIGYILTSIRDKTVIPASNKAVFEGSQFNEVTEIYLD